MLILLLVVSLGDDPGKHREKNGRDREGLNGMLAGSSPLCLFLWTVF